MHISLDGSKLGYLEKYTEGVNRSTRECDDI